MIKKFGEIIGFWCDFCSNVFENQIPTPSVSWLNDKVFRPDSILELKCIVFSGKYF
jgi:hypothetical protein